MKAEQGIYFIITTMDGIPVVQSDNSITQYLNTVSCRMNAKHRTFSSRTRHHTRGLTKKQFVQAQQEYQNNGFISLNTLGRKGD